MGMKPQTTYSEVMEIAKDLDRLDSECMAVLGGGSLIDGGKDAMLVSFDAFYQSDTSVNANVEGSSNGVDTVDELDERLSRTMLNSRELPKHTFDGSVMPMIAILTTLTGGVYNACGACTNGTTHRKWVFNKETQEPRFTILNAALRSTTPIRVTGVRARDHCIEALCSIKGNDNVNRKAIKLNRVLPRHSFC